jgi:hypothetical protein
MDGLDRHGLRIFFDFIFGLGQRTFEGVIFSQGANAKGDTGVLSFAQNDAVFLSVEGVTVRASGKATARAKADSSASLRNDKQRGTGRGRGKGVHSMHRREWLWVAGNLLDGVWLCRK